jgi:hypothetical protein
MQRKRLLPIAAAVAAAVLALAACGGDDDDESATTTSAAPAATTTQATDTTPTTTEETTTEAEPAPPPPPPPPPAPEVTTVRIVITGGKPEGGIHRETIKQNEQVRLVVKSDVADEIHLHGYDLMKDVEAGGTATIAFKADVPGQFEVELEDRGLQIAELTVEP